MAKKRSSQFICQSCGAVAHRWAGRCEACGAWNTMVEESQSSGVGAGPARVTSTGRKLQLVSLAGETIEAPRLASGNAEFDRVAGGGLVPGSALLVGGDPGIGKSTLLIQVSAQLAARNARVIYVSGEEAVAQVRLRAERLGLRDAPVELAAETNVEDIIATISEGPTPGLVIIDSIQTLWTDSADSAPGTVTQVRLCSQALIKFAKKTGAAVVLVGHVTKDGQIAGPRVVEHMVDAVLYFQGDGAHQYRLLRSIKNRFGPADEIGVFEMTGKGLSEVANPSAIFMGERDNNSPGAAVFAGMEGSRPLLVEIQALVAESSLGTPRRAVVGWDSGRLAMILAVLDAHCGVKLGGHDVYLNVAGGLKVSEPAADLAIAAALVSSRVGMPLPREHVFFGEVSLSGSVRPVGQPQSRLKESAKLGFSDAILPSANIDGASEDLDLRLSGFDDLRTLVARIASQEE